MSDVIEWTPSDDEYVEADTGEIPFTTALYTAECTECGNTLPWTIIADPDSPVWEAECCEKYYSMHVESVTMSRSDATY